MNNIYTLDIPDFMNQYTFDDFMNESFNNNEFIYSIMEATATHTNKENIFQKLWKIIKTAIGAIVKAFKKFGIAVKSVINKITKNNVASTNEIVGNEIKPPQSKLSDINKDYVKRKSIPADESSAVKPGDIDVIYSNLLLNIDKDKKIHIGLVKAIANRHNITIRNQSSFLTYSIPCVIAIIKHPNLLKQCQDIINRLSKLVINNPILGSNNQYIISNSHYSIDNVNHEINDLENEVTLLASNLCLKIPGNIFPTVTYEEILEAGKNINELFIKISDFDKIFDKNGYGNFSGKLCNVVNVYSTILMNLLFGINSLCNGLKSIYQVNGIYENSIKDISILDKIVDKMIDNGIPSKYIMYNIFILSDPKLYGDESIDKPKWGQSRVVFIPNKDYIYKIALNGPGIRANNAEIKIYNDFTTHNIANVLCKVDKIPNSNRNTIIKADYVGKPYASKFNNTAAADVAATKFEADLNKNIKKAGIQYKIYDVHRKNIGFNNKGDAVIIDYGSFYY